MWPAGAGGETKSRIISSYDHERSREPLTRRMVSCDPWPCRTIEVATNPVEERSLMSERGEPPQINYNRNSFYYGSVEYEPTHKYPPKVRQWIRRWYEADK
jgi:hypothetical protein